MTHTQLPQDPVILLSYINTQLRDFHASLEDLCLSFQIDEKELTDKLLPIGYAYNRELNQFVRL